MVLGSQLDFKVIGMFFLLKAIFQIGQTITELGVYNRHDMKLQNIHKSQETDKTNPCKMLLHTSKLLTTLQLLANQILAM